MGPVASTLAGRVAGRDLDGVVQFRGIPYAEPPVGARRFRPAQPHAGWTGVREAIEFGARARQPRSLLAPADETESEDCLFLNVWTPGLDDAHRPVMVWIHGGSFTTGSGALAWYDGSALARRGVVVVTINYRLGPFGFLHLEPIGGPQWAGAANCGLTDQALALRWVADNIAAFGGDPHEVTIFGESAGGMSVSSHLALPASRGLFRRAVAQSGAAGHVQPTERGERVARAVLDALGVGDDLEGLAAADGAAVIATIGAAERELHGAALPLPFQPTVDGSTLPVAPVEALASGGAADVELLCGTTADEMRLFRLMAVFNGQRVEVDDARLARRVARLVEAGRSTRRADDVLATYRTSYPTFDAADLWSQILTDLTFTVPADHMLDAHHAGGGTSWHYLFAHQSSGFEGTLGACHALEVPFVFDNLDARGVKVFLGERTEARRSLAASMADAWASFARGDGPTLHAGAAWPSHDPQRRATMILDLQPAVVDDPNQATRRVWDGASVSGLR